MKTPRLVSLCFVILTLATLLHAEPPASPSKEDGLTEKMNALQQAVSDLRGENYVLTSAMPESLEKELARLMKLPVDEIHTLVEKGLQSADSLVQAQALLAHAELPKADLSYDKVLSAKDADPKRLRQAHHGKGLIAHANLDYATALKHYQSGLALVDKTSEPLAWAKCAGRVSLVQFGQSQFKEAEPLMREILRLQELKRGPLHPDVSEALNNLAALLHNTDRLEDAEALLRRSLAIREGYFGKDHPKVATVLFNLTKLLQDTGRLKEAETFLRRSLAINESSYGENHLSVAEDIDSLAHLLHATKRLKEELPLRRRSLAICETLYGNEHREIVSRLTNLASILGTTGSLIEAESMYRRALAIDEVALGKDHPDVAIDLNNLATFLQGTRRPKEAEPFMKRALRISEDSLGKKHPNTLALRKNWETLQKDMGK